jgi:hypothetical protein
VPEEAFGQCRVQICGATDDVDVEAYSRRDAESLISLQLSREPETLSPIDNHWGSHGYRVDYAVRLDAKKE